MLAGVQIGRAVTLTGSVIGTGVKTIVHSTTSVVPIRRTVVQFGLATLSSYQIVVK
jgi:hypothetical protein